MVFGERIKSLRLERQWTQDYVCEKLNISPGALSRYETSMYEPKSLELVKDFANLFEVSTDFLLGKSDVRNPEKTINDEDVKIVADSGILGLNDYNRQVAIDIIKGLKAKQDIDEKNKKD